MKNLLLTASRAARRQVQFTPKRVARNTAGEEQRNDVGKVEGYGQGTEYFQEARTRGGRKGMHRGPVRIE
jgi:hypothetical protein